MKPSTKPLSSPGRHDKYPPPLMGFLRSNVGNKSREKLRSSPMFVRKKNTAIETQEPSSPKVTCMGKVRIKKSSSKKAPTKPRCHCIRNALFCKHFTRKSNSSSFLPDFPKWVLFLQMGFRREPKPNQDSSKKESNFVRAVENSEKKDEEEEENELSVSSPPRNALLLTRCASSPCRTSSLSSRFWSSEETREEQKKTEYENGEENLEIEKSVSQKRGSVLDKKSKRCEEFEEKLRFFKELEDSIRERFVKPENFKKLESGEEERVGGSAGPLILTRCKSEPART